MARKTRMTIAALGAAAALALTGCSAVEDLFGGGGEEPERDPSGQVTESQDAADVFTIKVGDCIGSFEDGSEVAELPVVPCSDPHDQEVYASFMVPEADAFPGTDAVNSQAETDCAAEFETFVGVPYEESALYVQFLTPTEESWGQGDREILCTIYDPEGQTTGSLQDAGR